MHVMTNGKATFRCLVITGTAANAAFALADVDRASAPPSVALTGASPTMLGGPERAGAGSR